MSHDDIRARLAAVQGIEWRIERERGEEYYGDWLNVGPVKLMTTFSPGPRDAATTSQAEAVAEFIRPAAADIRRLLDAEEGLVENEIYGPPPAPDRGEPARLLADAIEVLRPDGSAVRIDLVAFANIALAAQRENVGLHAEIDTLKRRLDNQKDRQQRAGELLAWRGDAW
ncbi:hypothetical protein DP939_02370 [Spongiactinospora rosea]|uniref:Uncharacterized protein n=1 Tax=Spongiactinospora rosea TaxID=2248750 RepID=A0A366M5U8_9ACTN|nr:hypothetical protein [Spongiactinospora rosea]RBQ21576.1 hypothetical protein DP939_02370 [Spongiactinospora rosea]